MFVGEQVMEQLCPGLVLVQYPGFVFLDDEIVPSDRSTDIFGSLPYSHETVFPCTRTASETGFW